MNLSNIHIYAANIQLILIYIRVLQRIRRNSI